MPIVTLPFDSWHAGVNALRAPGRVPAIVVQTTGPPSLEGQQRWQQ